MSRRVTAKRSLLGAVFLTAAVFLYASPFNFSTPSAGPAKLLEQSYDLSKHLTAFPRTYYLRTLLANTSDIASQQQYEQWDDEMFRLASQMTDGFSRVAEEKNAVVLLSRINPVRAMQLFSRIEDPQPDWDGTYPEDVRSNGARAVFQNYWLFQPDPSAKLKTLPALETEARRLAQTGEYPYVAMGFIIEQLDHMQSDEAKKNIDNIFAEAVRFYDAGSHKFLNRDRLFQTFLLATKNFVLDRNLVQQAAEVFAKKVQQSPLDMDFEAEIDTPKGVVTFTDDRTELLFETLPTIKELAPKVSEDLIQKYPVFTKAMEPMTILEAGYVNPGHPPAEASQLHGRLLQASIVKELRKSVQRNNLALAKELMQRLTDDASHIEAVAALLPALKQSAPEEASRVYDSERPRLQEVRDPRKHLSALVAMAEASSTMQDSASFASFTLAAVHEGTALFIEDSLHRPLWTPSERDGYAALKRIVTFAAAHNVDSLHREIEQLQDPELKANMLVFEARGIQDGQSGKH